MNDMKLEEIAKTLEGKILHAGEGVEEIDFSIVCACDMMSDLLMIMNDFESRDSGTLLLTGLTNPQVVRTSEMVDIQLVVVVRGKTPSEETVQLAKSCGISLMTTPYSMFKCCGLLHTLQMQDVFYEKESI